MKTYFNVAFFTVAYVTAQNAASKENMFNSHFIILCSLGIMQIHLWIVFGVYATIRCACDIVEGNLLFAFPWKKRLSCVIIGTDL